MNYPLTLLFDGGCPLCRLEMDRLRERDGMRRLVFVDISAPGFDAADYTPEASLAQMLKAIHGVLPDGSLVTGVDTLRLAYEAVGLGWWFLPSRLPGMKTVADRLYAAFARDRYRISRRVSPWVPACDSGACERRSS